MYRDEEDVFGGLDKKAHCYARRGKYAQAGRRRAEKRGASAKRKGRATKRSAFQGCFSAKSYAQDFLYLLLKAARPIRPEPTRNIVQGSGTAEILTTMSLKSLSLLP